MVFRCVRGAETLKASLPQWRAGQRIRTPDFEFDQEGHVTWHLHYPGRHDLWKPMGRSDLVPAASQSFPPHWGSSGDCLTEGCWKYQNSHYCCNELSCLIAPSMKDSWLFREPSIQQPGSPPIGNCKPAGSIEATASDQTGRRRWGCFQSEWTGSPNHHLMNGDFSAYPESFTKGIGGHWA